MRQALTKKDALGIDAAIDANVSTKVTFVFVILVRMR